MKLLFLILLSVFTIESALASPNPLSWCSKIFPKIKNSLTLSKLDSHTKTISKEEIKKILDSHEPEVAVSLFLEVLQQTNEVSQLMVQVLKDKKYLIHEDALQFLKTQDGTQVTEIYKQLLLGIEGFSMSDQEKIIEQTLETQEPEVAESLFSQALPKTQKPWIQKDLIETLEKVAEKNPQLETQLTLIDLFQNENTVPFIKRDIAQFLSEIENSVNEVSQFMVQVLKDKKYFLIHEDALQFFKNQDGTQVTEIYKQLLPIIDEISISAQEGLIKQILETQEPAVAEAIFTDFTKNLKTMIQKHSFLTLENVAVKNPQLETQLALAKLFNHVNFVTQRAIMDLLTVFENLSDEVIQSLNQAREESSNDLLKKAIDQFLKKHKKK